MLLISQSQWPNLVPYPLFISWRSIFLIATVVCIICLKLLLFLMFSLQFVFRFDFLAFVFRCFVFIIANIKYLLFFFFFYFIYLFIFFSLVKYLLLIQKKKKKFDLVVYFILFYLCVCVYWIAGNFGGNNPSPIYHRRCSPQGLFIVYIWLVLVQWENFIYDCFLCWDSVSAFGIYSCNSCDLVIGLDPRDLIVGLIN